MMSIRVIAYTLIMLVAPRAAASSDAAPASCAAHESGSSLSEMGVELQELEELALQQVTLLQVSKALSSRKVGCTAPVNDPQIGLLVAAVAYPKNARGHAELQTNRSVYQHSYRVLSNNVVDAEDELHANGYQEQKTWTKTEGVPGTSSYDEDQSVWWANGGKCVLAFRGSDSYADFHNNWDPTPVTAWGVDGVHTGIVAELSGLVDLMIPDLRRVKAVCTESLMVAGHSLGGGAAQLFTVVANKADDPFGAGLTVDSLYTFGAMPVADHKLTNDKTQDGCFPGALMYNAMYYNEGEGPAWYNPPGGYPYLGSDIVKSKSIGGSFHLTIKADKILMVDATNHVLYECGKFLSDVGPAKGMGMHAITLYEERLGCAGLVP